MLKSALLLLPVITALACSETQETMTATTTAALEPLPTQEVVPSEPIGVTPVTHELTASGAVTLRVPVKVPDGRSRMTPDVDLRYDSNGDNGLVGVGWRVSGMSSITRCARIAALDGAPEPIHYDGTDRFCLDGERLILVSGTYGAVGSIYRTEDDQFARIVREGYTKPTGWRVEHADGRVAHYGSTVTTQLQGQWLSVVNAAQPTPTLQATVTQSWMLADLADRSGNSITYEYDKSLDTTNLQAYEMRPARILYAGGREVRFVYQDRTDKIDRWVAGFHRRETKRLANIETYVAGALVRRYWLAYRTDSITKRSLFASISECDGAGVCLPKTSFKWDLGTWDHDVIATNINDVGVFAQSAFRMNVADINGDGRDDLLYPDENNNWWMRYSTGTGFGARVAAGLPHLANNYDSIVRINDFDRDGRVDVLAVDCQTPTTCQNQIWAIYQWDGTQFTRRYQGVFGSNDSVSNGVETFLLDLDGDGLADMLQSDASGRVWRHQRFTGSTWTALANANIVKNPYTHGYRVIDHDGDGRSELMRRDPSTPPADSLTGIGRTETGTFANEPTNLPCGVAGPNGQECGWREEFRQPDFNGDGIEDAVFPWAGDQMLTLSARVNTGKGFGPDQPGPTDYVAPVQYEDSLLSGTSGAITDDMNGDGRDDLVLLYDHLPNSGPGTGIEIYTSTGTAFSRIDLPYSAGTANTFGWGTTRTADIDGDGLRDIVQIYLGRVRILRRRGGHADVITAVTPQLAGTTMRFAYSDIGKEGVHTQAATCALPTRCAVRGVRVVTDAWLANGLGGENHQSIRYAGGRRDLKGRGFVGFASRTLTDDSRHQVTTTTYSTLPSGSYYTFAGRPATVRDSFMLVSGRLYDRIVTNAWADAGSGSLHRAALSSSTTQYFDRAGILYPYLPFRTITRSWIYDAYGNPTRETTAITGGSTDVVNTTYDNRTGPWLLGLATNRSSSRCTASACATRTSAASFDALGRIAWSQRDTPAQPDAYRRMNVVERDAFGNITIASVSTTAATRTSTTAYDADGIYPVEVVDPLGHHRRIEVEPALGVLTQVDDPNGISFYVQYDGFGRLRGRKLDGGETTFINYVAGASHPLAIRVRSVGGDDVTSELDALGRVIEETSLGLDGRAVYQSVTYDALGEMASRTRHHYAGEPAQVSTYAHDELGRLVTTVTPDAATQRMQYLQLETRRTDALGRTTRYVHDADGALVRTYEPHPTSTTQELLTQYVRGPDGIDRVIDPMGNTTAHLYDGVGRRWWTNDPDRGTTTLAYNGFDELQQVTHADGAVTAYTRDVGGRVTRIDSADGATTFTYDSAMLGMLAAANSTSGVASHFEYDAYGRSVRTTWDIEGEHFAIARGYDGFGRVTSTMYPTGTVVDNLYDGYGHVRELRRAGATLWRVNTADAEGHLQDVSFGNGVVEQRTFMPARGWLDTITTVDPSGAALRSLDYGYDAAGKVSSLRDGVSNRFESYAYDRLDRLQSWTVGQGLSTLRRTRFDYDHAGNLLVEDVELGAGTDLAYAVAGAHQLASGPEGAYAYDQRGRQVAGPTRTIDFTDFNLPSQINRSGAITTFAYDAFGDRVRKVAADETTITLADLYERRTLPGGAFEQRLHVRAGPRSVADIVIDGSGGEQTRYLHADRMSSMTLTTDAAGHVVERLRFDPWGRRVTDENVPTPIADSRRTDVRDGFTGQEHDDELGLINMKGRMYDPHTRRFLSADPFVVDPTSSQAWNPYSYVRNSPLNATDPSGLFENLGVSFDELLGGPNNTSEPDPSEPAPACEPDPHEACPGGCSTEQSADQGVADETSDSAEVDPMEAMADSYFVQQAKDENERTGGRGIVYFLDHADAKIDWDPHPTINDIVKSIDKYKSEYDTEEENEAAVMATAKLLAEQAGYTFVWVSGSIDINDLRAAIDDDDTVGVILDTHGNTGSLRLRDTQVDQDGWIDPHELKRIGGANLKFVVALACQLLDTKESWTQAFGAPVFAEVGYNSWGSVRQHATVERAMAANLDLIK